MEESTINKIRDLAVKIKNSALEGAYELMAIAHKKRPRGKYIETKYNQYRNDLEKIIRAKRAKEHLNKLVEIGDIAVIPIGFRCMARQRIAEKLGIKQASLPFDSGFFSPYSVAKIIENPNIELKYNDHGNTHRVCTKTEPYNSQEYGYGIKFDTSTYDEINNVAISRDVTGINKYLDSTFGYYTLDIEHKFVLAHYNWHFLASKEKSKGIVQPEKNLENINIMLNRRISRMLKMCRDARHIFFISFEGEGYNFIKIDDDVYSLKDFDLLKEALEKHFGGKYELMNIEEIGSVEDVLEKI